MNAVLAVVVVAGILAWALDAWLEIDQLGKLGAWAVGLGIGVWLALTHFPRLR